MRSEPPTGDELTRLLVSMKHNVLEQVAHEPAPKKRSTVADRVAGLTLGIVVLFGLGAGAAFALGVVPPLGGPAPVADATPTAVPSETPSPTPTPSDYAVTPGQPPSRYNLSCDTLVDAALVSDLLPSEVAPADRLVTESGAGIGIPTHSSILSIGGTVCEWSNGMPMDNLQYGGNPGYVGVIVSVVPRPTGGWSEAASAYGQPADENYCSGNSCSGSAVIGDAWVSVTAEGGDSNQLIPSAWQPLLDAITQSVAAAGPAAPPSRPEQVSSTTVGDCEAVLPLDSVRSIAATPAAVTAPKGPHGNWGESSEARRTAGNVGCRWLIPESEARVADVDWLHEGRWAYERMLLAGTATPVALAGLHPDDDAVIRCDDTFDTSCAVDLRIGQDWLNVTGNDRNTAIALAEAVLAQRAIR